MNSYLTGASIRQLREARHLTQSQLAAQIGVSDKAVSKWETGRGLPDITLLEPLAAALGVSVPELLSGDQVVNRNLSCNVSRTKLYVCPVCGNVLFGMGDAHISCCGITLPALEAEEPDEGHIVRMEPVEDEMYLTLDHPMTKEHYISFLAFVSSDSIRFTKLYPEGNPETACRCGASAPSTPTATATACSSSGSCAGRVDSARALC